MSLFPAYSGSNINVVETCSETVENQDGASTEWLKNSSYREEVSLRNPITVISSDTSSDDSITIVPFPGTKRSQPDIVDLDSDSNADENRRKAKRAKKRKTLKSKLKISGFGNEVSYDRDVRNVYFEDREKNKGRLVARPRYNISDKFLAFLPSNKKRKKVVILRYHAVNIDYPGKLGKADTIIKRSKERHKNDNEHEMEALDWGKDIKEEQTQRTREFNEKLTENPNDVQLWLQYVHFQDTLAQFDGGLKTNDSSTANCQRKLSIIEKALMENSDSKELLRMKLTLMAELVPADQFSNEVEVLLNKDSGNILLWQALIMATQASLALCTVPKVLSLYSRCLSTLRQRSRTNPHLYDERIMEMLYHCLSFLRHSGLWEQMWETLRLNLSLNLNLSKNSFQFRGSIDERKLIGMEEVILTSQLPLNQLWLRVESLREHCHWISVNRNQLELVGDSRRFILPEDVADFIHPMVSRNSNLRLAIYSLLSLKVPLLPMRDSAARDLKLEDLDWGVESVEALLPLAYPSVSVVAGHKGRSSLIEGILEWQLTSGPQYMRFHPAQESYLDFVRDAFRTIGESPPLTQHERTSIYVWWLRFERLLVYLNQNNDSEQRRKKLKTILKEFLKKEENRHNLHFYREYALIEREAGRFESCITILETAIESQDKCLSLTSNIEDRTVLFSVYRVLLETLLQVETYQESHRDRVLVAISRSVSGSDGDRLMLAEEFLESTVQEFLREPPAEEVHDILFLPNLECDVITCYAYFLYAKKVDIAEVTAMMESCLEHFKRSPYLQERLYESTIAILQLYCEQTQCPQSRLKETLVRALNLYPRNFYMLSVAAVLESDQPSWRLSSGSGIGEPWRALAMCLAGRARFRRLEKLGLHDAAAAALNKLLSLYRRLARTPETQRCPLIWRLYMLLLREENLCEKKGEEVYHESIAQCPWARGIYTDAAQVAPQLLTQIQDVIREKELRMHVTPEELNILRG